MANSPLLGNLSNRKEPTMPNPSDSYVGKAGALDESSSETIEIPRAELVALQDQLKQLTETVDDLLGSGEVESAEEEGAETSEHENEVKSLADEIGGMGR